MPSLKVPFGRLCRRRRRGDAVRLYELLYPAPRNRGLVALRCAEAVEPLRACPIGAPARLTGGCPILGYVADTRARQNELDHVDELSCGETACHCSHGGPERPRALLRSSQDDARCQMLRAVMGHSPRCAETERSDATALATSLLRGFGTRLSHSATVAAQVDRVARLVEQGWRTAVKDAAWLHDVGYSRKLALTEFHPLDGARWLRDHDWPPETCRLVAWHTEPLEQARRHRLDGELSAEFDRPPGVAAAALAWADLTSSPTGERWDSERRLADILMRYPLGSLVHEATRASLPALRRAVWTIEDLLACAA